MKSYKVMLTTYEGIGAYLVGEGSSTIGIPCVVWSQNSFHTNRVDATVLSFTHDEDKAKIIHGTRNLKSWLARLYDQIDYYDVEICAVNILVVADDK